MPPSPRTSTTSYLPIFEGFPTTAIAQITVPAQTPYQGFSLPRSRLYFAPCLMQKSARKRQIRVGAWYNDLSRSECRLLVIVLRTGGCGKRNTALRPSEHLQFDLGD